MTASSVAPCVPLPRQPGVARRELVRFLRDADWDGDVEGATLAVHEALVNAEDHAGGVSSAGMTFDGEALVVRVCDRGEGFGVPDSPAMPDIGAERGRGLCLIRRLSSSAEVIRSGPEVCLLLRFER